MIMLDYKRERRRGSKIWEKVIRQKVNATLPDYVIRKLLSN